MCATCEGLSLSDYLLQEVRRVAERPTLAELRHRLARRSAVTPRAPPGPGRESGARGPVIVVDASAVLEVLLNTRVGARLVDRLFAPGESLHAPRLLDIEVAQVLRRYARTGELDSARGLEALEDLADLPLARYPHELLLSRIWALRDNVTAYDAAYVALAEALDAPLVTHAALASTRTHQARIDLF